MALFPVVLRISPYFRQSPLRYPTVGFEVSLNEQFRDIDEYIDITELFWDKSNPKKPVGYYTATWLSAEGEIQQQERAITIVEEIKLEIGL